MKKTPLLILLISFLEGCRTQPRSFTGTQCSPVFSYEEIAGVNYINVENSKCYCRQYNVSPDYIGATSDTTNNPIDKCNKIIGYSPKEYTELNSLMEYARQNYGDKPKLTPELGR